jgi:hypothetical protein
MVQIATNIYPPSSISNMFDSWLWGINKDFKPLALLWVASICWVIWRHRNNVVFERKLQQILCILYTHHSLALYLLCAT